MSPLIADEVLKTFKIIADTREKKWNHISSSLRAVNTPCEQRKLNYGDYTCEVEFDDKTQISLSDKVVVERKASLDELAGNFTKGRERFDREFRRAVNDNAKVFLLIENSSYEGILNHSYRSKFSPKSFLATLFSWQAKYNITVIFCKSETTGKLIKGVLYYAMRDYLLNYEDGEEVC